MFAKNLPAHIIDFLEKEKQKKEILKREQLHLPIPQNKENIPKQEKEKKIENVNEVFKIN